MHDIMENIMVTDIVIAISRVNCLQYNFYRQQNSIKSHTTLETKAEYFFYELQNYLIHCHRTQGKAEKQCI